MANASAVRLVRALKVAGMSNRQIANALGRNDSMISQIALDKRGTGYGSNLVPALRNLHDVGRVDAPVARRLRASGIPAAVREGPQRVQGGVAITAHSPQATRHALEQARHSGRRVKVSMTFGKLRKGKSKRQMASNDAVLIGSKNGEKAETLLARLDGFGSGKARGRGRGAFAALARDSGHEVSEASYFQGATVLILD